MALSQHFKWSHLSPPKFNYMKGLKSVILAIFQTGPGWPCHVSMAFNNPLQDLKKYFWVPMNSEQCRQAKLEQVHFSTIQYCKVKVLHYIQYGLYFQYALYFFRRSCRKYLLLTKLFDEIEAECLCFAFFIDIGDSSHQWTQNDLGMIFEEINLKRKLISNQTSVHQQYQLELCKHGTLYRAATVDFWQARQSQWRPLCRRTAAAAFLILKIQPWTKPWQPCLPQHPCYIPQLIQFLVFMY